MQLDYIQKITRIYKMEGSTVSGHRTVMLVSSDIPLRARMCVGLGNLRWKVTEASGGAEAFSRLEEYSRGALVVDEQFHDLEMIEFLDRVKVIYPNMDLLHFDGTPIACSARSPHRQELLYALREATEVFPTQTANSVVSPNAESRIQGAAPFSSEHLGKSLCADTDSSHTYLSPASAQGPATWTQSLSEIEGLIGTSPRIIELKKMIHLVAPRSATVLIEGETGTGKELVAQAIHCLSKRSKKPLLIVNCAAIPEALLEAELFGHTRGAFTGATEDRKGRAEAADGGTLFLDEIGEMSASLQAKMLRFLENGEIQKIGDNDTTKVDVRVIAATHQHLEQRAQEGTFRLDLYHRLVVFPVEIPPLRDRIEDMSSLCDHFLAIMARTGQSHTLSSAALSELQQYDWPGNVRELAHVLERGAILAGDSPEISLTDIRLRRRGRR